MNNNFIQSLSTFLTLCLLITLNSCSSKTKKNTKKEIKKTKYASDITPFFDHWKLILGNGSNIGIANEYEHKDFFYTTNDNNGDWVVYKAPNFGGTHGTSKNTRTELAQIKKWSPLSDAKLTATLKVMNVSKSGDDSKSSAHSVVVGQIHSADGHENEPLKIFYKKFPNHTKGSVYWNYEINTKGDDNSGRWDFSTGVWGKKASFNTKDSIYPEEPKNGIALGEEFSYEVEVKEGIMKLKFISEGHETKLFTKNLIVSEFTTNAHSPKNRDGIERKNGYANEGLFFKLGSYNQTNGISNGAETYNGDIQKQYETENYTEVWFKEATIFVSDDAISNNGYFTKNDKY